MTTGPRCAVIRRTASAASTIALSDPYGPDPCPGRPTTRSRRPAPPFSPTATVRLPRGPSGTPPDSVRTASTSTRSYRCCVIQSTPHVLPCSSSATAASTRSPRSRCPLSAIARVTTVNADVSPSMSIAPRPQTQPSTSSPPNGSRVHPSGSTGTTSVCPTSASDGAPGSVPRRRATSDVRPGCGSTHSTSRPRPSSTSATARALRASCPEPTVPSLTHALRIIAWSSSVVRPASSVRDGAGAGSASTRGPGVALVPGRVPGAAGRAATVIVRSLLSWTTPGARPGARGGRGWPRRAHACTPPAGRAGSARPPPARRRARGA